MTVSESFKLQLLTSSNEVMDISAMDVYDATNCNDSFHEEQLIDSALHLIRTYFSEGA